MKFSPDLTIRVRSALEGKGFCFLSSDEIQRLLAHVPPSPTARQRALKEFAGLCGARVETTTHLKSARFVLEEAAPQETMPWIDAFPGAALAWSPSSTLCEAMKQTTPKALNLPAQGCEERATLGRFSASAQP